MDRTYRRTGLPLLAFALLACASISSGVSTAEEGYVGSETCSACHEELVAEFGFTSHASAKGWTAETGCEACHGPGEAHASGDVDAITKLGELPPREAAETCLACHQRQEKHFQFNQSIHQLGDVGCVDCHDPHSKKTQLLERTGRALCADCHQAIASQFDLPRAHPLSDGGEGCVRCHEPHATRALRTSTTMFDDTCMDCHFEKKGPFLYSHDVTFVEGCASCHEVHGAPNRHLLKHETQVNLCYQCHSGSVTPGWHSGVRFFNEKCTACHSAIHGSNTSPVFLEE